MTASGNFLVARSTRRDPLGDEGCTNLENANNHMRQLDLFRETEEPGRSGENNTPGSVERQMHWHGDRPYNSQLVVGHKAVGNDRNAENDRNPFLGAAI